MSRQRKEIEITFRPIPDADLSTRLGELYDILLVDLPDKVGHVSHSDDSAIRTREKEK